MCKSSQAAWARGDAGVLADWCAAAGGPVGRTAPPGEGRQKGWLRRHPQNGAATPY
jgi:hypothetical protein